MLDSVGDDPNVLQMLTTVDESRIYGYDVEIKAQLSEWKLSQELGPRRVPMTQKRKFYVKDLGFMYKYTT